MWQEILTWLRKSPEILKVSYLDNRILDYLVAVAVFFICVLAIKIFEKIILKRVKVWAQGRKTPLIELVINVGEANIPPLLYFGAFYLSVHNLNISPWLSQGIYVIAVLFVTVIMIRSLIRLVEYIVLANQQKTTAMQMASQGVFTLIKTVLYGLGIIFILDNLGFKISTIIAGLGIGGIAVALAAQNILGDLFNYFVILSDKPFEIGDFIIIGDYMGAVEYIGIKTTRIRSLSGEQLIFPNTDLTNSRVRNYKRMERRRVVFKIDVTYETTLEQLKEIPTIIKNIIKEIKETELDRVHFALYGPHSLVFEIVYYVLSSDYNKYMDIQQKINFTIKEEFAKHKIEFAYPTQIVYVK